VSSVTLGRPSLRLVLAAVAAWVVLITALHLVVNGRVALGPRAEARTLQVGGLPVT
jgi:hypothetical protein